MTRRDRMEPAGVVVHDEEMDRPVGQLRAESQLPTIRRPRKEDDGAAFIGRAADLPRATLRDLMHVFSRWGHGEYIRSLPERDPAAGRRPRRSKQTIGGWAGLD